MSILDRTFGPDAPNRLADATTEGRAGALAALESFYYALNNRDLDTLTAVWADDPLVRLDNPLGGILTGTPAITGLYGRIFASPARVTVRFEDIAEYGDDRNAVFAGREIGTFVGADGTTLPLAIRTTRYFRYDEGRDGRDGRWVQVHHHGSIDDPDALRAYQQAIAG